MGKITLLFILLLIFPINEDILSPWGPWTYTCKHFISSNRKKYTLKIVTDQHKFKCFTVFYHYITQSYTNAMFQI